MNNANRTRLRRTAQQEPGPFKHLPGQPASTRRAGESSDQQRRGCLPFAAQLVAIERRGAAPDALSSEVRP
jgi:hypothetical protein